MQLQLKVAIPYYTATICVFLLFAILQIIKHLPLFHLLVPKLMKSISTVEMEKETYWDSMFSWNMYKAITNIILKELQKKVCILGNAPNITLSTVRGQRHNLLEVFQSGKPLILNFGSHTCPVFMARLEEFTQLVKEFNHVADFLIIYIEEAHPSDGWAFKNNVSIPQHKSLEERCAAARKLQSSVDLPCPLLVDTMADEASSSYAALPIRLYVIQEGRIMYAGGPGPTSYNLSEVRNCLENWKTSNPELEKIRKTQTKRKTFPRAG